MVVDDGTGPGAAKQHADMLSDESSGCSSAAGTAAVSRTGFVIQPEPLLWQL